MLTDLSSNVNFDLILLVAILLSLLLASFLGRYKSRLPYIENYQFHPGINEKLQKKYPHLSQSDVCMVIEALRSYFHVCHVAGKKPVAMPSRVVDEAWHEFILFTQNYRQFCKVGLGRFLHHTPTVALNKVERSPSSLKRAWRLSCAREKVDHNNPAALPLLFAIDGLLDIEEGFHYSLDCTCSVKRGDAIGCCVAHIGCSNSANCASSCSSALGAASALNAESEGPSPRFSFFTNAEGAVTSGDNGSSMSSCGSSCSSSSD